MVKVSEKKIDFVVTWVDGNDEKWQKEKQFYKNKSKQLNNDHFENWNASKIRYRDWDTLRYWFRGVEKNCNWVNKIYFVTCGQTPTWLNTENPKLVLVDHKDFIPKEYLPTFNSNAIELNMHRIKGLSENFVSFNDDFFVLKKLKKTDFFKNGKPRASAILNLVMPDEFGHSEYNNTVIINKYYKKNHVIFSNFFKWFNIKYFPEIIRTFCLMPWPKFPRLFETHLPIPHQKKYFNILWKTEFDRLNETCSNKFRENQDLNHWLMSDWYIINGNFVPRRPNLGKHFEVEIDKKICKIIKNKKYKVVCINDINSITDEKFEIQKKMLLDAFDSVFPEKSSYEK